MKPLFYTRHARNRMRLYRITRNEVELALEDPDFLELDADNHLNATKVIASRIIRVTYVEEESQTVIITVMPKDRLGIAHKNGA